MTHRLATHFWSLVILTTYISGVARGATWSEKFKQLLTGLADDALGVQHMQDYLDREVKYSTSSFHGRGLVQEISQGIGSKFASAEKAVNNIKLKYESTYNDLRTSSRYFDCCNPPREVTFSYDARMKGYVNIDFMCYVGVGSKKSSTKRMGGEILSLLQGNYRKQGRVKWQYLATEEGIMYIYPASKNCLFKSDTFDPRLRSWYVETATPKPKNVVIVIDHSYSMAALEGTSTHMHIARQAAHTVVDTLNPNDAVAVVQFSTVAKVPTSRYLPTCFQYGLAPGTPRNKVYLKKMIDTITASGNTQYIAALNKAVKLLVSDNSTLNGERDGVILFLTDGAPGETEKEIKDAIAKYNQKYNNSIVLLTFGIGDASSSSILQEMAEMTRTKIKSGVYRKGTFTTITDPHDLRSAMGTYYNFFSRDKSGLTIAVPYFDGFGLGLITSICTPLVTSQTLRGVACADISLSELLDGATFFRPSELSYAFIVDNFGRLMSHPLLPKLSEYAAQPLFVDMLQIEKSSGAKDILSSMLRGGSGNITMTSPRIVSRGDSNHDGVTSKSVTSDYFWTSIPNTNYSVCIVIGRNDKVIEYSFVDPVASFLYHRIDLLRPSGMCNHISQLAVNNNVSVKFTPHAFRNPSAYLDIPETMDQIQMYEDIMTGKVINTDIFKANVKDIVAISSGASQIWVSPENIEKTKNYFKWKYIGANSGVFLGFPGSPLYKQFDHTERPWYRKAMSNRGQIIVTPPYKDAGGSGTILTLATTLYEGGFLSRTSNRPIFGVIGLDFTVAHLGSLINKAFPECIKGPTECFVMDNSGYLIYHPVFLLNGSRVEHVHIAHKEPEIATSLISKGHMTRHACLNIASAKNHFFWTVELRTSNSYVRQSGGYRSVGYELHRITGSNLFLGKITKKKYYSRCACPTNSYSHRSRGQTCEGSTNRKPNSCECPCKLSAVFSSCLNKFPKKGDQYPPCVPDPPAVTNNATLGNSIARQLKSCFDYKCSEISSERDCDMNVGCRWCTKLPDGSNLYNPVCRNLAENCPATVNNESQVAAIVLGIFIPLIIIGIVIGVVMYLRHRRQKSNEEDTNSSSNTESGPVTFTANTRRGENEASRKRSSRPEASAPRDLSVYEKPRVDEYIGQNHSSAPFNPSYHNASFKMGEDDVDDDQPPPYHEI